MEINEMQQAKVKIPQKIHLMMTTLLLFLMVMMMIVITSIINCQSLYLFQALLQALDINSII